jgi:hypothetical protein
MAKHVIKKKQYKEYFKTFDGYEVVEGVEIATVDDRTGETTYHKTPYKRTKVNRPTNALWGGFNV